MVMQKIQFQGETYQVSFEAMPQALKKTLSKEELTNYLQLLEEVQKTPKKVYEKVKAFCQNHLDVPEIINLLTFAHIRNRQIKEAEKLIRETFENYPHYLFARINYADQCLRKKKLEKIPELFPSYSLKELCPDKRVFHTSEFRGFMVFMSYYFLALEDKEKALLYFSAAKEADPADLGVIYLERKLFRVPFLKKIGRLLMGKTVKVQL